MRERSFHRWPAWAPPTIHEFFENKSCKYAKFHQAVVLVAAIYVCLPPISFRIECARPLTDGERMNIFLYLL